MVRTKKQSKKTERQLLDLINTDGVCFEKVPCLKKGYLIEFEIINNMTLEQTAAIKELIKEYGYIIQIVLEFNK